MSLYSIPSNIPKICTCSTVMPLVQDYGEAHKKKIFRKWDDWKISTIDSFLKLQGNNCFLLPHKQRNPHCRIQRQYCANFNYFKVIGKILEKGTEDNNRNFFLHKLEENLFHFLLCIPRGVESQWRCSVSKAVTEGAISRSFSASSSCHKQLKYFLKGEMMTRTSQSEEKEGVTLSLLILPWDKQWIFVPWTLKISLLFHYTHSL